MAQPYEQGLARELRELVLSLLRTAPPSPLSRTAAATLSTLERLGPQRITRLAELEVVTQPAMTGVVQRLECSALVTRQADPADARAALISITDAGRTALAERRTRHDEAIVARLDLLSDDDRALLVAATPALHQLTEHHVL